jgi:hypothetical protein
MSGIGEEDVNADGTAAAAVAAAAAEKRERSLEEDGGDHGDEDEINRKSRLFRGRNGVCFVNFTLLNEQ